MSDYGQDVNLSVPMFVDADFNINRDGVCSIVCLIYSGDEDEPYEVHVDLEGVVESCIEFYAEDADYQRLYSLAHEFSRMAEMMREKACLIEDSTSVVRDLYSVDD